MRPFLLVGVGGSGGKTLRAIKQALSLRLRQVGWHEGIPAAWQFLHIDSVTTQDGNDFPADFLDQGEYLSLVPNGVAYAGIYGTLTGKVTAEFRADLERPLPSTEDVMVPVALGAGAYRAIGRTMAAAAMGQIHAKAKTALTAMSSPRAQADLKALAAKLGSKSDDVGEPEVFIISSIAGGSGAGMFLDVTEAVKSAAAGATYADHTTAILYAPDVFEQIGNMRNIAPNALGAIAETMSGYWNTTPSESTQAMYQSQGVIIGANEEYRIGPKYVYLVGRKNSGNIDFHSQSAVYRAVGSSITALLTSDLIQSDFASYFKANFSSRAESVPDKTRLKRETKDPTPLSALGFARLSLGMERFSEYAAERLAKESLKTMLERHLEQDPNTKEKTAEQWVTFYADLNEGRFLTGSGLNEVTEANNQVIDALRPGERMGEFNAQLRAALQQFAEAGAAPTGQSFNDWVSKIVNAFENNIQSQLSLVSTARHQKIRAWVDQQPEKLIKLTLRTISELGLPVTIELLRRLNNQVSKASAELLEERAHHLADTQNVSLLVSAALNAVASMQSIPKAHPAVESAYEQACNAFAWRAEAELKADASLLIQDLGTNFIANLEKSLSAAQSALSSKTSEPKLADLRDNPFNAWPDFAQSSVDSKFKPAPNEALLIDTEEYSKIFFELIEQTVMDKAVDSKREVVRELIEGSWGSEVVANLEEDSRWVLINPTQKWIPTNPNFQIRSAGGGQQAAFEFEHDHMKYVSMAGKWINVPGRAFKAFIDQKIANFLDQKNDAQNAPARLQKFQREFTKFVSSADPLVEINPSLLSAVHTRSSVSKMVICSEIPIDQSGAVFDSCKAMLMQAGLWDDSKSPSWFVGPGAGANANSIDIFTSLNEPYEPMVMSSVVNPIAKQWVESQDLKSNREAFMKWRRGRTLSETIPAHPEVWAKMLRGWFVARLLNQVAQDKGETYKEKGPKISIWCDGADNYQDFPFPLMAAKVDSSDDLPGIILNSLQIAIVDCYTKSSLKPLMPFHRLLDLGELDSEDLKGWIVDGSTVSGAPEIKADRAGSNTMDSAGRKAKCIEFFEAELKIFNELMEKCSPNERNPRVFPLTWEIRSEVRRALQSAIDGIKAIEADRGL